MQLTKSVAVTWAPDNIQGNAVLPGWVDTDLMRHGHKAISGLDNRVLADTAAGYRGRIDDRFQLHVDFGAMHHYGLSSID